jgi:hypothetical protein
MLPRQKRREFLEGLHASLARQSIIAAAEEGDHPENGIGRRDHGV